MAKKNLDGVHWKRREDRQLIYFWRIGAEKSKEYKDEEQCAMDYVTKYIERFPKYKDLVDGRTWEQKFRLFEIKIQGRA